MRVFKDSVVYLIGEMLARTAPFLLLPYLSRKLGVAGFGELSYYQTFMAIFVIVIGLSQDGAVARYFYIYGKRSLNLVIHTGYAYSLCVASILLLYFYFIQSEILAYLTISVLFQSFLAIQLSVRQCQKQAFPYTIIQFCSALCSTLLTILMLEIYETDLVEKRIIAILISNILVWAGSYLLYLKNSHKKSFTLNNYLQALSYLLAFGLPLIIHNLSLFLRGQLDRIFIYHKFSETELGLYAMGLQIASILMVIIQAINKALIPYFYEGLKKKRIELKHIHKWAILSLFITPIPTLIVWLTPENVILWLLGEHFIGVKYYISLFIFSTTLIIPYLILVNYFFYLGKNKLISICSFLSTSVYVVSLMILIQTDIQYVPYSSIIGAVIILPILYIMTKRVK